MAKLSEKREGQSNPPTDQNPHSLPFNSVFDQSNPIGLLESAINFMSSHCDLLKIDSLEETVVCLVRSAKENALTEAKAKKKREAEVSAEKAAEGKKKRQLLVPNRHNGDPEIDIQKFVHEPSEISHLDSETQSSGEKSGLPISEKTKIQEQPEKSNVQNPNKDFSGGK